MVLAKKVPKLEIITDKFLPAKSGRIERQSSWIWLTSLSAIITIFVINYKLSYDSFIIHPSIRYPFGYI
jgi:hypothetical protein